MINTQQESINPDLYCYDTGLTFGADVAAEVLALVKATPEIFTRRNNYADVRKVSALFRKEGAEGAREIVRRNKQALDANPGLSLIDFKQYLFTEDLKDRLLATVPDWLKITPTEPDAMLQVSENGEYLAVHKGHYRKCSLFMLLESDGQETRWYRNTEEFKVYDSLRIPDLDKIEHVVSAVMEPNRWYMFNHYEWHSVHRFTRGGQRISIGLDFNSIYADQLLNLLKHNS